MIFVLDRVTHFALAHQEIDVRMLSASARIELNDICFDGLIALFCSVHFVSDRSSFTTIAILNHSLILSSLLQQLCCNCDVDNVITITVSQLSQHCVIVISGSYVQQPVLADWNCTGLPHVVTISSTS